MKPDETEYDIVNELVERQHLSERQRRWYAERMAKAIVRRESSGPAKLTRDTSAPVKGWLGFSEPEMHDLKEENQGWQK